MTLELLPWQPPPLGAAVALPNELRWIRLPVPGPLQHINVWLAPGKSGRVLIDTGLNQPETHAAWEALAHSEHLADELEAILVTHHHPDHFGMAAALAARFEIPVRMSAPTRAAALRSSSGTVGGSAADLAAYRREWGVDFEALVARARGAGSFEKLLSGIPAETAAIVEGERIGELRDPWQASLHFGHAEGHVCLYWRDAELLISGDQLLPAISSNVSLYPGAASEDPLGDFLASLRKLARLPPQTIVLPAHGAPFRGAATRAAQVQAGHQQRLAKLSDFAREPRGTAEVVGALFGARKLEGWNTLLAYGETLAHMRYLHLRGALLRLEEGDEVRWVRH
ncbi:MAG TPA: MBL fold metallo-hydrolase [Steroidobacteraceae bacterium]|nr:MBL fold metallo-hydrolase [Steroidobacteraceae bacterium]